MPFTLTTLLYEELVTETERAWCFIFEEGLPPVYLPKSQVEDIRETSREIDIPIWLVDAKGLEDYVKVTGT